MLLGGGLAKEYSSYAFINVDNFLRSQYNPTRFPHLYIFYQNFSPRFFLLEFFLPRCFYRCFFFVFFFRIFFTGIFFLRAFSGGTDALGWSTVGAPRPSDRAPQPSAGATRPSDDEEPLSYIPLLAAGAPRVPTPNLIPVQKLSPKKPAPPVDMSSLSFSSLAEASSCEPAAAAAAAQSPKMSIKQRKKAAYAAAVAAATAAPAASAWQPTADVKDFGAVAACLVSGERCVWIPTMFHRSITAVDTLNKAPVRARQF